MNALRWLIFQLEYSARILKKRDWRVFIILGGARMPLFLWLITGTSLLLQDDFGGIFFFQAI